MMRIMRTGCIHDWKNGEIVLVFPKLLQNSVLWPSEVSSDEVVESEHLKCESVLVESEHLKCESVLVAREDLLEIVRSIKSSQQSDRLPGTHLDLGTLLI